MFASGTEIAGGGFECKDIGGRLYLWMPVKESPKRLIVTAHGIRRTTSSFRIRQKVTLNFYSADKNSVNDPGLREFYEGRATPVETLKQGEDCYNYILSKYTNSANNTSHNSKRESYKSINALMKEDYFTTGSAALRDAQNALADRVMGVGRYEADRDMALRRILLKKAAILTVRNRRLRPDVNLEWVLKALHDAGHRFTTVECLFCRNTVWTAFVGSLPFGPDYSDSVPIS